MLTWIRGLLGHGSGVRDASARRQRQAREAVAGKHEKEGTHDLMLGEKTSDSQLIETGQNRLAMAERLRSDEMSLLEALNLGFEDREDDEGDA